MKYILSIVFLSIAFVGKAQNYNDSTLPLTLSQRGAVYIGYYVQKNFSWTERTAPAYMKDYIRNGTSLDSLFTVSVKAGWVKGMIELLLSGSNEVVQADRLSIINNSPAIPGYTALANQIVALANGSSQYKQVAIFIRDYYLQRISDFSNLRTENIQSVVNWSKN